MSLTVQVSKFSGNPSQSWWGQVHDFTPQEAEKASTRGRLIAIFSLSIQTLDQLEMIKVGREILTRLHEEYYGEVGKDPFTALKTAVEQVSTEFSSPDSPLQVGALALIEGKVVFAGNGISAFVLRQGSLAKILSDSATSGAGNLMPGDTFLLGNKDFLHGIPEGNIKASLEKSNSHEILETLTPFIYENKKDNAVGVVAKFQSEAQKINMVINNFQEESRVYFPTNNLSGFKGKLVGLIDGIIAKIPQRKIRITSDFGDLEEGSKKKKVILVGGLLLLLLICSIFFGIQQRNSKAARGKYEDRLIEAQHQLEEAKTLTTLNGARARELLFLARGTANTLKDEGVKDTRLDQLVSDINANIGGIAGIYEVEPEIYLDLSLLSNGFKADDVSVSEGRMLVLDRQGRLVSINVSTKKTRTIAGPEKISNAQFVAAYADRNFVLTDDQVSEVAGNVNAAIDKDWEQAGGMHAYAANIYILDKGESVIWRYAGLTDGFGSQTNWFAPGIEVNLSNVVSWSIDGSIWLLTDSGEIERYSNGSPQTFRLSGVGGDLSGATYIFSDDITEFLYILDPKKGRVIVMDKEGNYKAEYVGEKIKETTKVIVSEEDNKMILVAGEKLYSVEIKHL